MTAQRIQAGFSLIEIIIALAIIAFAILIFLSSTGSFIFTQRVNFQNIALRIATRQMENLRNTAFGSLPPSGPLTDSDLPRLPAGSANLTISDYASSNLIKNVIVNISWEENGATKNVTLETLISQGGI